MAYYSGQVASYQELLDVLVAACITEGWTWADGILRKNGCYIKLEVITSGTATGIRATGGTGISGSSLLNPAPTRPRMGNPGIVNLIQFPVVYHIFIFDDEVYFKIKFANTFYYLAFGKVNPALLENGTWISATACGAGNRTDTNGSIRIGSSGGGAGGAYNASAAAPFWNNNNYSDDWSNSVLFHDLDGVKWSSGNKNAVSALFISPLLDRIPSLWTGEAIFLPINIYLDRPANKKSLVCQFQHSRTLRIDNYEPEQIVNLGNEKWMIFPFYKKDSVNRGGGFDIDHTGTFGWAIRYDGP